MKLRFKLLVLALLCIPALSYANDMVIKEPPKSLDKLYPPVNKEQKWVHLMHSLSGHFGGVFVDMAEQDWENAEKHANQLVETYKEAADLVPEWKDYFDHDAAKNFAAEVKTHDPEKINKAKTPLGKTCGKCHAEQYVGVWTKYQWPATENIKLVDPVGEKELKYDKYMWLLVSSLNGMTVNFGEGQYDRSKKALGNFKKQYMELKSVCAKCHTGDAVKQFYVGEDVAKAFANLDTELSAAKPNPANFWKNVDTVSTEGCKKCHLTHRSYSIIREAWEKK